MRVIQTSSHAVSNIHPFSALYEAVVLWQESACNYILTLRCSDVVKTCRQLHFLASVHLALQLFFLFWKLTDQQSILKTNCCEEKQATRTSFLNSSKTLFWYRLKRQKIHALLNFKFHLWIQQQLWSGSSIWNTTPKPLQLRRRAETRGAISFLCSSFSFFPLDLRKSSKTNRKHITQPPSYTDPSSL